MQKPPYSRKLVIGHFANVVYKIQFEKPLPAAVTATKYNFVNLEAFSSSFANVMNNSFHDGFSRMVSAWCDTKLRTLQGLLKASHMIYKGNTVARAAGLHVYSEPEWLEGALGIHNVTIESNRIIDNAWPTGPPHVDVMPGLKDIRCLDNSFVEGGKVDRQGDGC